MSESSPGERVQALRVTTLKVFRSDFRRVIALDGGVVGVRQGSRTLGELRHDP